jgi:hypothetical protein
MNPPYAPISTNIRQRVFDAIAAGFRTILIVNNYETNAGQNVFVWKTDALDQARLPAIVLRDVGLDPAEPSNANCAQYRLRCEAALVPPDGADSLSEARKIWADVISLFRFNRQWQGEGDLLVVTTEYQGDEMRVDERAKTFTGIFVRFVVIFKMKNLDAYTPAP